ncbi:MAG: diguanylate cyclase [Firmicutes bacterium]|nr:diguanylate cyclase [Bacillota bacterium]
MALLWGAGWLQANEHFFFRTFDERQGLTESTITALAQDQDGFLYVGTASGLFRYDGGHFTLIPLREEAKAPWILSLIRHPAGGMWVGTLNGLARVKGFEVSWATFEGTDNRLDIHGMALDAKGTCWIPNRRGMFTQTGPLTFALDRSTTDWNPRNTIAVTNGQRDIVVLDGDLVLHRRDTQGTWIHQGCPELGGRRPICLTQDAKGRVWCVLDGQIWRTDQSGTPFQRRVGWLRGGVTSQTDFFPDDQGGVWVPTTEGLFYLDEGPSDRVGYAEGLPEQEFNRVFWDDQGFLWIGGQGLHRRLGWGWYKISSFLDHSVGYHLRSVHVGQISGRVYLGFEDGLHLFEKGALVQIKGTGAAIFSMQEDQGGNLWVSTETDGFWRLQAGARALERIPGPPGIANGKWTRDKNGTLYLFDAMQDAFKLIQEGKTLRWEPMKVPLLPGQTVVSTAGLAFDANGGLWAGSSWGLQHFNGLVWQAITTKDGLRSNAVVQILPLSDGSVWVRYEDPIGLTRLSYANGQFKVMEHLNAPDHLPIGNVQDMKVDGQGQLWVLTSQGLVRHFNAKSFLLNRAEGFPLGIFQEGSLGVDFHGGIWVATGRYLVHSASGAIPDSLPPPKARITSFAHARQEWLLPSPAQWGDIAFQDASLTFRVATWGSEEIGSERFQVWLEGHEDGWRDTIQDHIVYPRLREGTYTFHVRAARRLGEWGPEDTLKVHIRAPWYRSWPALVVWALMLVAVIRTWLVFRLRRVLNQQRNLEEEVKARTVELNRLNEALLEQTFIDPLTGLRNRRFLQSTIHMDLRKSLHHYRSSGANARRGDLKNPDLIFLMVDIDFFKKINDRWGHSAGDLVLGQVAELLRKAMRDTDNIVRWGGEEFLVTARDSNRVEGAMIAERICTLIRNHAFVIPGDRTIPVTCSVGFAPFPCDPARLSESSWEQVIDVADHCLYIAKLSGRNGWVGVQEAFDTMPLPWEKAEIQALSEAGRIELRHSAEKLTFQ